MTPEEQFATLQSAFAASVAATREVDLLVLRPHTASEMEAALDKRTKAAAEYEKAVGGKP